MKTVKITYPNGAIRYASKSKDQYFPIGGGFGFIPHDEAKIEEIDSIPNNMKEGLVCIDGSELISKAIWDKNRRWNGWLMPKIEAEDAKKIVAEHTDKEYTGLEMDGENILVIDYQYGENNEIICPELINGKTYYNLGYMGWVWEEYRYETED
tara:strand:+ start:1783 stop:2241 length:459 start_codon:yes stop_codon:yes gene_type:complete